MLRTIVAYCGAIGILASISGGAVSILIGLVGGSRKLFMTGVILFCAGCAACWFMSKLARIDATDPTCHG